MNLAALESTTTALHRAPEVKGRTPAVRAVCTRSEVARSAKRPVSCTTCALKDVCLPRGLGAAALSQMDDLTRAKRRVKKGATLLRSGDAFESLYAVRSGAFKCVGVSRIGEEKVTGMHLPGEVIGLDAINSGRHGFDAVALEDSEVCVVPYAQLTRLALQMPALQAQLLRMLSGDIGRDQGLLLLLGAMDAEQRIAAFLMSLARRYERLGYAASRFNVRMSRQEIGSYLGLRLETVSRVFSRFERDGLIAARQKEVTIEDPERLLDKVGHWYSDQQSHEER